MNTEPFVFCALDFETGGKDPRLHALTEAAAVWFTLNRDGTGPHILDTFARTLNPAPGLCVLPVALKIQGRTFDDVYSGKHSDELLTFHELRVRHEQHGSPTLIAHNADFETGFLRAWSERAGMPDWSEKKGGDVRRSMVCTQRLTAFARSIGVLNPGTNDFNAALAEFMLKRKGKAHEATEDATLTAKLFAQLYGTIALHFQMQGAQMPDLQHLRPAPSLLAVGLEPSHGNPVPTLPALESVADRHIVEHWRKTIADYQSRYNNDSVYDPADPARVAINRLCNELATVPVGTLEVPPTP